MTSCVLEAAVDERCYVMRRFGVTGYEHYRQRSVKQEGLVPFVVDAVYAMAHALEDLRKHKCPRRRHGMCAHFLPISGEELLASIRNVSFEGIFRATKNRKF